MIEVPGRISLQKLYDLSVESGCLAHSALLARSIWACSINLQQCLKNGHGARSSENLCATVSLGIYEVCRSSAVGNKIDGLCSG